RFAEIYHRSMDERVRHGRKAGDSKTGRHLFGHLTASGATILAAGSSDWVVHSDGTRYEADEAYFLHHIIYTLESELLQHAELDPSAVRQWALDRHGLIERAEL